MVKRGQAAQDHDGEQLHVRGSRMEMRVWKNLPRGSAPYYEELIKLAQA